ncbi:MAG: hypothetical protein F8N38_15430 [Hungatella sp.]|nr:hypothetical protein [Hungatella sp.]
MDETEVVYGTIGVLPDGEFDPDKQYDILNLVSYDGSSYVVHTKPPIGTLPTNLDYWQVSALGTSKATANSVGTVKPDGTTTEVSTDGSLSVKTATQDALGLVKGSAGIKVASDGSIDVNTLFEQATELANIIAGEAIASVFGKVAKSIAVTMGLNENALLKNMLTNMDANDQNKIPTSAFVHTLWARIGMGEDLDIGANLTAVVKALNSNLGNKANASDFAKYNMEYHARIHLTSGWISGTINDKIAQGYMGGDIQLVNYAPPDSYLGEAYGIIKWVLVFSDIAHLQFIKARDNTTVTRALSTTEGFDTGWVVH